MGRGTGGFRDWLTLLHPPYTLWHLSYVAIGAAVMPNLVLWRLGGTLVARWFGKYNESAAIAANFLFANVILIPSCLAILAWRSQVTFDQLQAIVLMIVGTILASSVGRVVYQISLTVTGGDNGFVTMFWNLVPALTAVVSLILSHWIADEHFAINPTFFLGSAVIGASLVLFSLKSWRQPAGRA